MYGFLFLILAGGCVLGSFVVEAALGSVPKAKVPRYRRLRRSFMGAGFGGLVAICIVPFVGHIVFALSNWMAGVLVQHGFPRSVFQWSILNIIFGVLFAGMAAGGGLGWWLTRERAK